MKFIKTILLFLALAVLFAGCADQLNMDAVQEEQAKVYIKFGENFARTIYPTSDHITQFRVILAPVPDTGNSQNAPEPAVFDVDTDEGIYGGNAPYFFIPYGRWIINAEVQLEINGTFHTLIKGSQPLNVFGASHTLNIEINTPAEGTGTFKYNVSYPATCNTVEVSLIKLNNGGDFTLDEENFYPESGVEGSRDIPSGFYFLTVSAYYEEAKAVIRNEIVHVYPQLETSINYVFTKLDFGADFITLSGTVKVFNNGEPVNAARVDVITSDSNNKDGGFGGGYGKDSIDMGGGNIYPNVYFDSDGNGTWSIELYNSSVQGRNTIEFQVSTLFGGKIIRTEPMPIDDASYSLGEVHFNFEVTELNQGGTQDVISNYESKWYSFDILGGNMYKIDLAAYWQGYIWVYNENGSLIADMYTWDASERGISFGAFQDGKVFIRISSYNMQPSYFEISYTETAIPVLTENEWTDGVIYGYGNEAWFSFEAQADKSYYLWTNTAYSGNNTYSLGDFVFGFYKPGSNEFNGYWNGWNNYNNPFNIYTETNGTVYVVVRSWDSKGTFAIGYTTTDAYRPGITLTGGNLGAYTWSDQDTQKGWELTSDLIEGLMAETFTHLELTFDLDQIEEGLGGLLISFNSSQYENWSNPSIWGDWINKENIQNPYIIDLTELYGFNDFITNLGTTYYAQIILGYYNDSLYDLPLISASLTDGN